MHQTAVSSSRHAVALDFLLSRIDYERTAGAGDPHRDFQLDRMHRLLERLGNPHVGLPIVHVAGTKGKGSTAAMTAAIMTAAGYRTGLYTSPHLERIEERVIIDGEPCSTEQFVALVEHLRPAVEQLDEEAARHDPPWTGPTYFDIITALALLHFVAERVDVAVTEVGLGGRLDSTNVVSPRVTVITSISYDHMQQLGPTLADIAREKAGIIKPGVPVVSGVLHAEGRAAIDEVRRRVGAPLVQLGEDFAFQYRPPRDLDQSASMGEMDFELRSADRSSIAESNGPGSDGRNRPGYKNLSLALLGRHQAANAAVALATVDQLRSHGFHVPESAVRRGLMSVHWPARVEVLARRPTVVLDAAHNLASIASLLETLEESFGARRRLLIFATTQDKQVREMLELLLPRFERVLLTRYANNPRGVPLEELDQMVSELSSLPREMHSTPAAAWHRAVGLAAPEHLICITGSFFLAAELRSLIRAECGIEKPANGSPGQDW
jgi:dihydrofolate synthase/folylpolyglutamate synthase